MYAGTKVRLVHWCTLRRTIGMGSPHEEHVYWVGRLQAICFLLYMTQSSVLINNKNLIPPNTVFDVFIYIICYSNIYKVSDLIIVGDLVVLSLSNTQMT